MPIEGKVYRLLAVLLLSAVIIIPTAIYLFNDAVDLRGTAALQSEGEPPEGEVSGEEVVASSDDESAESDQSSSEVQPEQEDQPEADTSDQTTMEDESNDVGEQADTSAEDETDSLSATETNEDAQSGEETDSTPSDTDSIPTSETPDDSDDEVEAVVTEESENNDEDSTSDSEATPSVAAPTPEPEFTSQTGDFELTEEPGAEATQEPLLEVTEEATPEVTPEFIQLEVSYACGPAGVSFTVANLGSDMQHPETYSIDGSAAGEIQLASGESTTITAGYGIPGLSVDDQTVQPDEPCLPPPALEVSAVCTAERGVVYVVVNTGGPMPAPQSYSIDGEPSGEFQLSEGGTAEIETGYGRPSFASGELAATTEEICNPPGRISGTVWLDANGDSEHTEGETGFAEITVILVMEDGSIREQVTADDGAYTFNDLLPGTYTVQIPVPPQEHLPTYDFDGGSDSGAVIVISTAEVIADFGYQPEPRGSISGLIWNDLNGDGTQGDEEPGLSGVVLNLTHDNSGDLISASTDDAGSYNFADLKAGSYLLTLDSEALPQNLQLVSNPIGQPDFTADVMLEIGETFTDLNFVFQPVPQGALSGIVWADLNANGIRDEAEPGLAGITLTLTSTESTAHFTTDSNGAYIFSDLPDDDYLIEITSDSLTDNFVLTADPDDTADGISSITITDSIFENVDFGLLPTRFGSISGLIWLETRNFGVRDASESGIAGVQIDLLDHGGTVMRTVTLTADGRYHFADLLPGSYTISINAATLPDRMFITYNPDGSDEFSTVINLPAGAVVENIEFGIIGTF